jgi:hypothetical protein
MTSSAKQSAPAVEREPLHTGLLKVVNPVFAAVLRSPAHRLLDFFRPRLLVLRITGRRTGRRYTVVVGRQEIDGRLSIVTSAPWRANLRGGADVEVTDAGRTFLARAVLVEDADEVADAYATAIDRVGWKAARRQIGTRINVGRTPTHAELRDAVHREHLSLIRLEAVGSPG